MKTNLRSLEGYKEALKAKAEERGVLNSFLKAQTLTQARKILWGVKKGGRLTRQKGETNAGSN